MNDISNNNTCKYNLFYPQLTLQIFNKFQAIFLFCFYYSTQISSIYVCVFSYKRYWFCYKFGNLSVSK